MISPTLVTLLFFLPSLSTKHFKTVQAHLELKSGNKVKIVHYCNGAKEFMAGNLWEHLDSVGIVLQSTVAYAH